MVEVSDNGQDTINRDSEIMNGVSDNGQVTINIDSDLAESMNESMQQMPKMLRSSGGGGGGEGEGEGEEDEEEGERERESDNIEEEPISDADKMNGSMQQMQKLLKSSAGRSNCCIFRVPQSLVETNKEAYQPQVVSIGPYHHGKDNLKMVEEHKWRFLREFLQRTNSTIDKYLDIVAPLEEEIRESYSEEIYRSPSDSGYLVKMMVLDGLFLVELFHKVARLTSTREVEPFFTMAWMLPSLMRDIIRLENQLPFIVLHKLFEGSEFSDSSLQWLILNFFNYVLERPKQVLNKCSKLMEGKHILDFYLMSFTANKSSHKIVKKTGKNLVCNPFLKVIKSATKLHNSGIIFKPNPSSDTLLDIKFENGQLKIPLITLDDFLTSLFLNCVAFEQCYGHCSKDVTAYVIFMGCLINTPADSSFLCDSKIIEKYLGSDKEISRFFNNLGKDVAFDINDNYLSGLFEAVNKYSMNGWHVVWAEFRHTYFGSSWSFMSAFAALMLLVLTFIQTFFAPYGYFHGVSGSPSSRPP